LGEKGKIIWR
jgi:hypothetical protein